MTDASGPRRPSPPSPPWVRVFYLTSGICILLGALLSAPTWYLAIFYNYTQGRVEDVLTDPVGEDQVRVQLVFRYPIADNTFTHGHQRVDAWGRTLDDPIMSEPEAAALRSDVLEATDDGQLHLVFYDPGEPYSTGRLREGGLEMYHVGLLLLLAGPAFWFAGLIMRAVFVPGKERRHA